MSMQLINIIKNNNKNKNIKMIFKIKNKYNVIYLMIYNFSINVKILIN